jgi:hypothetical protein
MFGVIRQCALMYALTSMALCTLNFNTTLTLVSSAVTTTHVSGHKTVQGLQRYDDAKLNGTIWLAKGWAVHGDCHQGSTVGPLITLFFAQCDLLKAF